MDKTNKSNLKKESATAYAVSSFVLSTWNFTGAAVAQLVEALHYKPEGSAFDS
jgi:hypothetical protein